MQQQKFCCFISKNIHFFVANRSGNSLHQLILISYPHNTKMDLFDPGEPEYSKCGCKYDET